MQQEHKEFQKQNQSKYFFFHRKDNWVRLLVGNAVLSVLLFNKKEKLFQQKQQSLKEIICDQFYQLDCFARTHIFLGKLAFLWKTQATSIEWLTKFCSCCIF